MLETADTSRDDLAILSYTSGTTGNPKAVTHSHGWGYAHLQMAPKHWLCIEEDDLVWATAAPGWQKWVWSPFLSILGTGQQRLSIMGVSNQKHILNYYKIIKSMCFVVRQLSIV